MKKIAILLSLVASYGMNRVKKERALDLAVEYAEVA